MYIDGNRALGNQEFHVDVILVKYTVLDLREVWYLPSTCRFENMFCVLQSPVNIRLTPAKQAEISNDKATLEAREILCDRKYISDLSSS